MRRAARATASVVILASTLLAAGCVNKPPLAIELLDFHHSASYATPPIVAVGPWDLRYSWDCKDALGAKRIAQPDFSYAVRHSDDESTASEAGSVVKRSEIDVMHASQPGDEKFHQVTQDYLVEHFQHPGIYYISVQTGCNWRVLVIDRKTGTVQAGGG